LRESGAVAKRFDNEADARKAAQATTAHWHVEREPAKPLQAFEDYLIEQGQEIVTGKFDDGEGWSSFWTERGLELEPHARNAYELLTGLKSDECGLILTDDEQYGASVDGLVEEDPEGPGQNEIKCFHRKKHARIVLFDEIPEEVIVQIQGQMFVTGRAWCDFISYHPDAHIPLYVKRIYRDAGYHEKLEKGLRYFSAALDELVAKMRAQMLD
jgi:exodeoxyribonuclease (lambda-induced)